MKVDLTPRDCDPMEVSIIIVNWNSREYLRKCFASLFAQPLPARTEIIVFDSGSYDGCKEMIAAEFPCVRFFQGENVGFARGNNQAVKHARGSSLLFLNPDTEVQGTAVAALQSVIGSQPDAGAVGGRLLNSDGSLQTSCVQAFPTLLNQVLNSDAGISLFPKCRIWGRAPLFAGSNQLVEAEVISGAALMMRRTVFEALGGFCEEYFMYSEDVELCLRATQRGLKNYYTGEATILHHGGGSSQTQPSRRSVELTLESSRLYFERTSGVARARYYRILMMLSALGRMLVFAPWALASPRAAARLRKWRHVLEWSLAGEAPRRLAKGEPAISSGK